MIYLIGRASTRTSGQTARPDAAPAHYLALHPTTRVRIPSSVSALAFEHCTMPQQPISRPTPIPRPHLGLVTCPHLRMHATEASAGHRLPHTMTHDSTPSSGNSQLRQVAVRRLLALLQHVQRPDILLKHPDKIFVTYV
jgi:hypothetical protein